MLTIAAIMSNRSPFSAPFDKRQLAEEKKDVRVLVNMRLTTTGVPMG